MEVVLISLFTGLLVGWFPRTPEKFLKFADRLVTFGLVPLLFSMGALLGTDPQIIARFRMIGLEALVLAVATTLGSVLVVLLVEKLFLHPRDIEELE